MRATLPNLSSLMLGTATLAGAAPVTGWVSLFDPQGGNPRFVAGTAATDSPVTTDADQDCIAANFPSVTLLDGDSITLSGAVSLDVALSGDAFRVGLFSGGAVAQDVGNPYVGLYTSTPTGGATSLKYGNGTHPDHPFGSGIVLVGGILPPGGGVAANTRIDFVLTIARDGDNLDVTTSFTDNGGYSKSTTVEDVDIRATAPGFAYTFNTAGFLMTDGMNGNRAAFSNIGVTTSSGPPPADTDGDGLPDAYEQAIIDADTGDAVDGLEDVMGTGASPVTTDFDGDGSSDGREFAAGTDPLDDDSDDDGLPDGVEDGTGEFVDAGHTGTDPLDADTDGDGLDDGLEVSLGLDPTDASSNLGRHLLGVDFNRDDALGSPSQSLFRVVSGSTDQGNNAASYAKTIGAHRVTISQPDGANLEFRGANADSSRAIPGGDTSLSFLVADFIATRKGAIDIGITGLAAGTYFFRSWHLDSLTGTGLGFAQGATTTTPNTIQARLGGVVRAWVQPTTLGSAGLNTTFIDDRRIPTLGFAFTHDGASPLTIELRATESDGSDRFLLLNGFELFQTTP